MTPAQRLAAEYGRGCQDRVSPELALENTIRALELWHALPIPAVRREEPLHIEVVYTVRAFPRSGTMMRSRAETVVLDQRLIEIFGHITHHIVADSDSDRIHDFLEHLFAERLAAAGRTYESAMVALHVRELSSRLPPLTPLNRGQWDQGDTLGRGQWLFTLAHELAHKVLTDDSVRTEWDVAYDVLAQAAIDEVASLTSDRADGGVDPPRDEFRIGPFLSLWNTILAGPDGRFVDQGPVDHAGFLRAKMYDPPTREEMLCDFYAAIAVRSVMARYTIPPIALATCALAIAGLGLLQYLDAAAREAPSANAKLSDAITRLFMLRGSLCALLRSEGASEETVREASRAMGDVVRVFGETFLVPLYINWALLPAMLFEDAATVAQSIWFGDDRDRLHSLFLQRPRSRRP